MGNKCDTITKPILRNLPSEGTGDTARSYTDSGKNISEFDYSTATQSSDELMYGFCAGTADTNVRRDYCSKVGNLEWEYKSAVGSCHYSDCNKGYSQETGCCNGCCGIVGKGVECRRTKFTGDSIQCCLNDFSGCGATLIPNDPQKYDLAFSTYEDGRTINQTTMGGDVPDPLIAESGWLCGKTNCSGTCDPCLRNINSDGNTLVKNVSTGKMAKCDSFTRDSNFGGFCRDNLLEYCSGGDLDDDDDSWIYRWMNNDGSYLRYGCLNVLARNVYDTSSPANENSIVPGCAATQLYFDSLGSTNCTPSDVADYNVNLIGIKYASQLVNQVTNKYAANGYSIGSTPGTVGYNPFQDFIYSNICCKFPFLCQNFLNSSCSAYTADQLGNSVSIANWCGCYLPDSEYSEYVDSYQINKECTPMCNRKSAIPLVTPSNQPRYCSGTNCIIDNLAIELGNVNISGDINVTQICGNCTSGSCTCLISSNTINLVGGDINSINTGETCTSTLCTAVNPDTGYTETIPCDYVEDPTDYFDSQKMEQQQARQKAIRQRNLIILIIIFVIVVIILGFYFLIRPNLNDINLPRLGIPIETPTKKENINTDEVDNFDTTNELIENTENADNLDITGKNSIF